MSGRILFAAALCSISSAALAAEQQFTTDKAEGTALSENSAWARETIKLDAGWKFAFGSQHKAETAHCRDRDWRTIDLPHDFQFEQPWDRESTGARGFKRCGTEAWYRKTFAYDPKWTGKRVKLEIEAAMSTAEVWVNEHKLAPIDYGYLGGTYDITDILADDKPNLIAIRCNTGKLRGSRWYTGGREVAAHAIESAGEPVALKLEVEEGEYKADGNDLVYVRVAAVDKEGRENLSVSGKVEFSCEGAGVFFACDNGDHYTDELFTSDITAKDFHRGTIQGIFRTSRTPGTLTLRATSPNLAPATAQVQIGK